MATMELLLVSCLNETAREAMDGQVDAVCNKWTPPPE